MLVYHSMSSNGSGSVEGHTQKQKAYRLLALADPISRPKHFHDIFHPRSPKTHWVEGM